MAKEMLVTTTEKIPGHNYEVLGEVFGVTTQSKNVFSNISAGLKNVVGGEIKARLREDAEAKGADAVVMMRFDSGSIGTDMQSVVSYGTAIKFTD